MTQRIFKPLQTLQATASTTLKNWHERSTYRKDLARLDSRLLADAGISEDERHRVLNRPFWKL